MIGVATTAQAWCAKSPEGRLIPWMAGPSRGGTWIKLEHQENVARDCLVKRGWRVVEVTISEVG
jgi:hypothetical protein